MLGLGLSLALGRQGYGSAGPKAPLYQNTVASTSWDLIHSDDPDALDTLTYLGNLAREFPTVGTLTCYVFRASFTDTTHTIEIYMASVNQPNPVDASYYANSAAAQVDAEKYAPRLGKLPLVYRRNIDHMIGYAGDGTDQGNEDLTSEDAGHFFVIYADRANTRITNNDLEESFFHEGSHASIQKDGSTDLDNYDFLNSAAWAAAKAADNAYISTYAMSADQEDFAESALVSWATIFHPDRLGADAAPIAAQIPNRIAFFRTIYAPRLLLADGSSSLMLVDGTSRLLKALP